MFVSWVAFGVLQECFVCPTNVQRFVRQLCSRHAHNCCHFLAQFPCYSCPTLTKTSTGVQSVAKHHTSTKFHKYPCSVSRVVPRAAILPYITTVLLQPYPAVRHPFPLTGAATVRRTQPYRPPTHHLWMGVATIVPRHPTWTSCTLSLSLSSLPELTNGRQAAN